MRWLMLLAVSMVAIVACNDAPAELPANRATPPASAATPTTNGPQPGTIPPALSAKEILSRSDEAMRALTWVRVELESVPTVTGNPPRRWVQEFAGWRRVRMTSKSYGDDPVPVDCVWQERTSPHPRYFDRSSGGLTGGLGGAMGATAATDVRVVAEEDLDGRSVWVIGYEFEAPSVEGPFTVWRTEWIAKQTFLLLRQEQTDGDPFGVRAHVTSVLADFDAGPAGRCPA